MGLLKSRYDKGNKIKTNIEKRKPSTALSMAIELKKKGLSVKDISKGTGLSIELIETL